MFWKLVLRSFIGKLENQFFKCVLGTNSNLCIKGNSVTEFPLFVLRSIRLDI